MENEIKIFSPQETFHKWEKQMPGTMYLRQPVNGIWQNYTWKDCGDEIRKMAAYLRSLNLEPESKIAILSKNCVHWILADYAIWMAGHISVPLYPNITHQTLNQILIHSESKIVFAGKLDDWHELKPGIPSEIKCIAFPIYGINEYENWNDVIKNIEPVKEINYRNINDVCTIMYTSGTTGKPKGVMHTFFNFAYAASYALPQLDVNSDARFFSYLPMCHIAERLLIEMGSLYAGGSVSFAESLETFPKNLSDTKPTVFLAVPRIWAKFQEKILDKIAQKKIDSYLKIPFIKNILQIKIKKNLGLKKAENIFSGAAPIPVELVKWFHKLGIKIQEAYAMTENSCYSHVNLRNKNKIGTVGQALPHVDVKISEQGEILIRHKALMKGYFKEPELTAEAFTADGYFKTGDKGEIDSEGYLKITGRVKDLFKTSKGKYVSPSPIEMKFAVNTDIEQVLVAGMGLPQPIVLIALTESAKKKTKNNVEEGIKKTLTDINETLNSFEKLEAAVIVKDVWTIDNGLLTPTLKVKRNEVEKKYQSNYEKWHDAKKSIVWEE